MIRSSIAIAVLVFYREALMYLAFSDFGERGSIRIKMIYVA